MKNNTKLGIVIASILLLLAGTITFMTLFFNKTAEVNELQEQIVTLEEDGEAMTYMATMLLDYTIQTEEYIMCLWKIMRNEIYGYECNDGYAQYTRDRNTLYEYDIVDHKIYDV